MRNFAALTIGLLALLVDGCTTVDVPKRLVPEIESAHSRNVANFKSAQGLGKGRMRRQFTEMVGKHFWESTVGASYLTSCYEKPHSYRGDVKLVGLMLHLEPVVYTKTAATTTPGLDHLKLVPEATGSLNDAEASALRRLRWGKELVQVKTKDSSISYLGAIRAETSCLKCHQDKKNGDLLGAFLYDYKLTK